MFYVGSLHRVCFWLHIFAASTLLWYTLDATDDISIYNVELTQTFTQPSEWYFKCYDHTLKKYTSKTDCKTEDKLFRIVHPAPVRAHKFNTFVAVIFFSYFSAFAHYLAMLCNSKETVWWRNLFIMFPVAEFAAAQEVDYRKEIVVRLIDYSCTASVMVALFSALWGAPTTWGVYISPVIMVIVVVVAFASSLSNVVPETTKALQGKNAVAKAVGWFAELFPCTQRPTVAWAYFAGLSLLYFFMLWFGVIKGLRVSAKSGDEGSGRGTMPPGVVVASVFVLLTFSSFVVPYIFETRAYLQNKINKTYLVLKYSSAWSAMSLISKVILHITFGTTVVSQGKVFSASTTEPPDVSMNVETRVIIFSLSAIAGGVVLFFVTWTLLKKSNPNVKP